MLIFWTNRWSAQFPTITRFGALFQTKVFEAQTIVQLGCEFIQNMAKFQCIAFGFLFIFCRIPEIYRIKKDRSHNVNGYFSEKRGLKNIYEKLCLYYTSILSSFNILFLNISKEIINKCENLNYLEIAYEFLKRLTSDKKD